MMCYIPLRSLLCTFINLCRQVGEPSPPSRAPDGPQAAPGEIIQLDAYISRGGSHLRFWSEGWVTDVMDAIKRKELSLQDGAKCLGVKYQSLYGRYRVHHGYLITRKGDESKKRRGEMNESGISDADISNLMGGDSEEANVNDEQNNEWDPSLNLEPLVQINATDGKEADDGDATDDSRDNALAKEQRQAHDSNAILGL